MNDQLRQSATTPALGESFDEVVLPHLDAAYRLARWLMRNEHDAEDVVQEASLRALRYFRTFTGGDGRAWFLRIVRNTCSGWRGHRFEALTDPFDEEQHRSSQPASDPETLLLQTDDATLIARGMRNLPDRFHRLLVLRELEGLSYRELADVMGIPIGTVMSSLSRARQAFRGALDSELNRSGIPKRTSSRTGGRRGTRSLNRGIAFADLTLPSPAFVDLSQQEVETLNPLVAAMIR
jgi:RNA polymerase sigma-70 factor (ECF subfamily)